jgi:hypothetical protein
VLGQLRVVLDLVGEEVGGDREGLAEQVAREVAHAELADEALGAQSLQLLERRAVLGVVARRPVQQEQVDSVEAEAAQAALGAAAQALRREVVDPHLGRDPDLARVHARAAQALPHLLLVAVRRRRVDVAVAGGEGVRHRLGGLVRLDLEYAEAHGGDLRATNRLGRWSRHGSLLSLPQ